MTRMHKFEMESSAQPVRRFFARARRPIKSLANMQDCKLIMYIFNSMHLQRLWLTAGHVLFFRRTLRSVHSAIPDHPKGRYSKQIEQNCLKRIHIWIWAWNQAGYHSTVPSNHYGFKWAPILFYIQMAIAYIFTYKFHYAQNYANYAKLRGVCKSIC